jgi:hypothetical protein
MRLGRNMVRIGQQKNARYITEIKTNKIQFLGSISALSTVYLIHVSAPLGPSSRGFK